MAKQSLTYSHDEFFRDTFADRETALDFLLRADTQFCPYYLPPEIKSLVNLSTLNISKDSVEPSGFASTPELKPSYSDLLYHLDWADNVAGDTGLYLYLLFEHKSYSDPWISLQLLGYQKSIWDLWRKQQAEKAREEARKRPQAAKLPPILPFVFYHGTSQWQIGLNFQDLLDLPKVLRPYVPQFQYLLCDLSAFSDAEIIGQVYLRARLLLLKYILHDELIAKLDDILGLLLHLEEAQTPMEHLRVMIQYLLGGVKAEQKDALLDKINQTITGGKLMTTIAEALIEEGKIIGEARGEARGRLDALRHTLAYRFDLPLDHFDASLHTLNLQTLIHLNKAIFEVDDLAAFEDLLTRLQVQAANPPGSTTTNDVPSLDDVLISNETSVENKV